MTSNRIKELRMQRGLTQEALGILVGTDKTKISRIERGELQLTTDFARHVTKALNVTIAEVMGETTAPRPGLAEDAAPYDASPGDPLARLEDAQRNRSLYRVHSRVLDELGISAGDVVLIDFSADAVAKVRPLQPVMVQLHNKDELAKSTTLVRQFVPPNLLVTNSRSENSAPINMATEDAHIKGVVISWHRAM